MEGKITVKVYIPCIYKSMIKKSNEAFTLRGKCLTRKYTEYDSNHLEYNLLIENFDESTTKYNSYIKFINNNFIKIKFYHENEQIDKEKAHFMLIFYDDLKLLDNYINTQSNQLQPHSFEKEIDENLKKYCSLILY